MPGGLAETVEPLVQPLIDPFDIGNDVDEGGASHLGRIVDLVFTGSVLADANAYDEVSPVSVQ